MEENLSFLSQVSLFRGIAADDLRGMLGCLNARKKFYRKQDIILLEGQDVSSVGIVLAGRAQIIKEDYMGNRNIMAEVLPGQLFAEAFSCVHTDKLPVTVLSVADSEIMWIDYRRIITVCSSACKFHTKLVENMLAVLAFKNIQLNQKIEHLSKRTTREKLLSYLSDQAEKCGDEFDIPFNRQELADYLCVDRSAMSNELCKLRDEGLLDFHFRHFLLKS
ncbi:MAG: Crp/Fnr family transcriptional regulator [Clostridia bacterium]|nr:Crp/Fnr family transcriptional regulator [Clostridia bacterium]